MSNIEWILIIITIFLVILLFRYIQLKKQIRNLADQVNELNSGNSQQMLDISLIDKDLERLAGILNQYNIRQRQAVAGVLRNEEYCTWKRAVWTSGKRSKDSDKFYSVEQVKGRDL